MKRFRDFLYEAKLTYNQQYEVHRNEIDMLSSAGFETWSSGTTFKDAPSLRGYGFGKRISVYTSSGTHREYKLWITFRHDNMTRVNSTVTTKLTRTDGANEYTGSPQTLDEKAHKNIKAAIKYIETIALEKLRNEFASIINMLTSLPVETIKNRGLLSTLYSIRKYTKVSNEKDAISFINKIKKLNPNNATQQAALAKKYIKSLR